MKKVKIITAVGTRPEIIRLSAVINKLEKYFDHILINTNQNFDKNLNQVFFKNFLIKKPKYTIKNNSKNPYIFLGKLFQYTDSIIKKEKPDAFLVLGDTNSCLCSYVAKRNMIPVFHIEAGNRAFDNRVPEEINRKIIDHIADINICYSDNSRNNLISEGCQLDTTFVSGSPLREVINNNLSKINNSNVIKKLSLQKKKFIVASIHRQENVENSSNIKKIFFALNKISKLLSSKVVITLHPKTKEKINKIKGVKSKNFLFCKPFDFFDYCKLQKEAKFVFSDSGTIAEESYMLNFPALNVRFSHERGEAMDNGCVMMTGLMENSIMQSVDVLKKQNFLGPKDRGIKINFYEEKNFSDKICTIINSYYNYVSEKKYFKK